MANSNVDRLELGTATALVGASVFTIHRVYTGHAGSLSDVRQATTADAGKLQRLIDADCLAGGLTVLAAGAVSVVTRSWLPLGLAVAAFLLVALYYHRTLAAAPVGGVAQTVEGETSEY